MGDTSRDPIDHERTSRPRVGQILKSPVKAPGLVFIAVGVVSFAISVALFAHRQSDAGTTAIVISVVAIAIGGYWLAREARRVRGLERQHDAGHQQ